jgi:hypothetical protein
VAARREIFRERAGRPSPLRVPACSGGSDAFDQAIQLQQPPQPPGQPDIAEAARPFKVDITQLDQHRLIVIGLIIMRRIEKRRLGPGGVAYPRECGQVGPSHWSRHGSIRRGRPRLGAASRVVSGGLNKDPVGVLLAALPPLAAFEKHDAIELPLRAMIASNNTKSIREVLSTSSKRSAWPTEIGLTSIFGQKSVEFSLNSLTWVRCLDPLVLKVGVADTQWADYLPDKPEEPVLALAVGHHHRAGSVRESRRWTRIIRRRRTLRSGLA